MHLTSLNRFGGKDDDVFRPQDFLDLDSQDSDNEILAKFNIHGGNKPDVILPPSMLLGAAGGVLNPTQGGPNGNEILGNVVNHH